MTTGILERVTRVMNAHNLFVLMDINDALSINWRVCQQISGELLEKHNYIGADVIEKVPEKDILAKLKAMAREYIKEHRNVLKQLERGMKPLKPNKT